MLLYYQVSPSNRLVVTHHPISPKNFTLDKLVACCCNFKLLHSLTLLTQSCFSSQLNSSTNFVKLLGARQTLGQGSSEAIVHST